jgi:hypothetical protein
MRPKPAARQPERQSRRVKKLPPELQPDEAPPAKRRRRQSDSAKKYVPMPVPTDPMPTDPMPSESLSVPMSRNRSVTTSHLSQSHLTTRLRGDWCGGVGSRIRPTKGYRCLGLDCTYLASRHSPRRTRWLWLPLRGIESGTIFPLAEGPTKPSLRPASGPSSNSFRKRVQCPLPGML